MAESSGLAIALAGVRMFGLGVLALLLSLPFDSRVGAVTFAFSGFQWNSLHFEPKSSWIFNDTTGCFKFYADLDLTFSASSGRLLYPFAVHMTDPGSTTVKSFSTSFVYHIQRPSPDFDTGPGIAFNIVPDNVTLGAPGDSMGLITDETSEAAKNYESDNHTLGVELDTYMNPGFSDTNNNHIGINLASMTSTYSFEPVYSLASSSTDLYQQIWIDYDEADSRVDIYYANYNEGKPAKPQGSRSGLDLSLLKESMFVGFSSANKIGSFDVPYVCGWSFSNDGIPAPSIVISQNATPGAPPSSVPSEGPNSEPTYRRKKMDVRIPVGVTVAALLFFVFAGFCIFILCRFWSHPLRIFISHAGGPDGSEKNFPTFLHDRMTKYRWPFSTLSNIKFFLDSKHIGYGEIFATRIFAELARFDVGLVVVTEAFFKGKWPMTELIAFVEAQMNDPTGRLRVLPLFYKLTPDEVRNHLKKGTWKRNWEEMREGNHPLEVEKCRHALNSLCGARGIVYCYSKRDHDDQYIEEVCKVLDEILRKERSFASYLRGTITSISCPK